MGRLWGGYGGATVGLRYERAVGDAVPPHYPENSEGPVEAAEVKQLQQVMRSPEGGLPALPREPQLYLLQSQLAGGVGAV
jgi:hypothetical protein